MIKYFSLPDYWNHFFYIQALVDYRKLHPDYFYSDRIFNSAYGLPPGAIWNGGRVPANRIPSLKQEDVYKYFNQLPDFHLRHTCTNLVLTEEMLKDPASNLIIDKYYKPEDYVIFGSELLHQYLLLKIPKEHFIYSTTLGLEDINIINQYSKDNIVVLNYKYNHDNEYLKQLTHPENIEILCAELCQDNCPFRQKHYVAMSKVNVGLPLEKDESCYCMLPEDKSEGQGSIVNWYLATLKHSISNDRIDELSNMGFQYFKIAGRGRFEGYYLAFVVYYLILPEYQELATQEIMRLAKKYKMMYEHFQPNKFRSI